MNECGAVSVGCSLSGGRDVDDENPLLLLHFLPSSSPSLGCWVRKCDIVFVWGWKNLDVECSLSSWTAAAASFCGPLVCIGPSVGSFDCLSVMRFSSFSVSFNLLSPWFNDNTSLFWLLLLFRPIRNGQTDRGDGRFNYHASITFYSRDDREGLLVGALSRRCWSLLFDRRTVGCARCGPKKELFETLVFILLSSKKNAKISYFWVSRLSFVLLLKLF